MVEKMQVKMELLPGPGFWRKPARTLGLAAPQMPVQTQGLVTLQLPGRLRKPERARKPGRTQKPEQLPEPTSNHLDDLTENHVISAGLYHLARERLKGLVEWIEKTNKELRGDE